MTFNARSGTSNDEQFDHQAFIARHAGGASVVKYAEDEIVFAQGDGADAAFFLVSGSAKVTVISAHGKEAVLALLKPGELFGEECLDGHRPRDVTVTATSASEIARIERDTVARALADDPPFAKLFLNQVLSQNERLREDLIDQLFNSSEKRLARILLTLAKSGMSDQSNVIAVPITQETLAHMVGTTRSRINQFMTKFRKLGYIEYDGQIRVHDSLLNVFLPDNAAREAC
jgi:CRP-like cAMP-binding protein